MDCRCVSLLPALFDSVRKKLVGVVLPGSAGWTDGSICCSKSCAFSDVQVSYVMDTTTPTCCRTCWLLNFVMVPIILTPFLFFRPKDALSVIFKKRFLTHQTVGHFSTVCQSISDELRAQRGQLCFRLLLIYDLHSS